MPNDNKKPEPLNVSQLKAKLSHYIRMVRQGREFIITDHKLPVAKIVPIDELIISEPTASFHSLLKEAREALAYGPLPASKTDSLKELLADRES